MVRFCILLLVLSQCACIWRSRTPLARAAQFLWDQQSEDGDWHSTTYRALHSGQFLTPFVLEALLQVPAGVYTAPTAKVDLALAFVRKNMRVDGALGLADAALPEEPNYATALAVGALCRARRPGWEQQVGLMTAYLRAQQFTGPNGWSTLDSAYGAWGTGGARRTPPDAGYVDLSITRHVIEALRASGAPPSDPALQAAHVFIEHCQNFDPQNPLAGDGGFFSSNINPEANQAGRDGDRFRSYGTATADGILAMLATGYELDDPRVVAAQRWLTTNHRQLTVPGFAGDAYRRWPQALAFSYAAAVSQAFRALNRGIASGVAETLEQSQHSDGGWSNPENLAREDDPLIATAFAVRALVVSRQPSP